MKITIPANNWRPRGYQNPVWDYFKNDGKRGLAVWHRRAGKDDIALNMTACALFERVGTYWHMLPEASQARKAIWEAVNPHTGRRRIDDAFPDELREATRENEMFIRFKNGSTWQVVGSDNYNSLVGSPPVGIVFSEWALADPTCWAYLRPILRENNGWAFFIYTPRGRNHGATLFESHKDDPEWFCQKLTAQDTDVFSQEALDQELREYCNEFGKEDGESRFRQEYLCDFNVAVIGAYYGRLMTEAEDDGRITRVLHDPALKVDTWWDLGHADATAIWFVQHAANEIHLIDHYEINGADPAHLARILQEKQTEHRYVYGRHLWPHDGGHSTLASKGLPFSNMMAELGVTVEVQPRHDKQVQIARCRQIIPRCYFDREKCATGIEALRNYHKEWNEKNRAFSPNPKHDWSSHSCDAFAVGALSDIDLNERHVTPRDRYSGRAARRGGSAWAA